MDDKVLINVEASVDAPSTISSKPAMSDKFSEALAYAKDGFAVIGTAFILSHAAQAADVTAKNDAEKATCIAVATQGTTSLRTLIEKKAAEWIEPAKLEMLKAKLQGNYDSIVDSCVKSAEADAAIAKTLEERAEANAKIAQADEKIAKADEKIAKATEEIAKSDDMIEKAKKERAEAKIRIAQASARGAEIDAQIVALNITAEMREKVDAEIAAKQEFFNAFLEGKKSTQEYNMMMAQLPQFIERVQAYIVVARKTLKDQESLAAINKMEAGLVKIVSFAPKGAITLSSL